MSRAVELATPRLRLRQWQERDKPHFARLNADPEVMRFFPGTQTREQSDRSIAVWAAELDQRGWSNWAVEQVSDGAFIGFVGLTVPKRALPFMPCVEIGYRLARPYWGRGLATEAGRAVLRFGFEQLALPEVVSFTARLNLPSQAVMRRLGMLDAGEDFEHPALAEGSPLRVHCLYRLSRERWAAGTAIEVPPRHLAFWNVFAKTRPADPTARFLEAFHFDDNAPSANELAQLVVAGRKRATAALLWSHEAEGKRIPRPGDLSIVTDFEGHAVCVIETTRVDIVAFSAVTAEFAETEGEGDGSLAYWMRAHEAFFGRECRRIGRAPTAGMPVVCERFEVVYRPAAT